MLMKYNSIYKFIHRIDIKDTISLVLDTLFICSFYWSVKL